MSNYSKITNVIVKKVYPLVAKSLEKNLNKYKAAIADFFNYNHKQIYDVAPYDNIYYRASDIDRLFNALGITEEEIVEIMKDCFYWNIPYNPGAAKEPYVIVLMMAIRYFLINKKIKEAEISEIYLAFSGKFYASIFVGHAFPKAPPSNHREVMDYVVNNMLTNKHDLKSQGTLFGAIKSMCNTWSDTYKDILCSNNLADDEVGALIQQLRDRERTFMMNIAKLFYDAYENKVYLNYETDNWSNTEEFRITTNDSLRATKCTDIAMNYMVNNSVSLNICNKCKDQNVKATEIKDIMESIISNKDNLKELNRVINILICDFIRNYPDKTVGSVDFIAHSIKMKPNTKDEYIIELKDTILKWLDENSPNYRRRKNRKATAISYYKSILTYITLCISTANLR